MKYFYDFEFYEDGSTIDPISLGMVDENGNELYLENVNFDWNRVPADHWLWDNVYPHLEGADSEYAASKFVMGDAVNGFIEKTEGNQLWGYFADYDHVCLAQLFGKMVNMPSHIPWYTLDIKQEAVRLGISTLPAQDEIEHHALSDARWNLKAFNYITTMDEEGWW